MIWFSKMIGGKTFGRSKFWWTEPRRRWSFGSGNYTEYHNGKMGIKTRSFSAYSAFIFTEGYVQYPVQAVFDTPVTTDGMGKKFNLVLHAANVVACFLLCFILVELPFTFNHTNCFQILPILFALKPVKTTIKLVLLLAMDWQMNLSSPGRSAPFNEC